MSLAFDGQDGIHETEKIKPTFSNSTPLLLKNDQKFNPNMLCSSFGRFISYLSFIDKMIDNS